MELRTLICIFWQSKMLLDVGKYEILFLSLTKQFTIAEHLRPWDDFRPSLRTLHSIPFCSRWSTSR